MFIIRWQKEWGDVSSDNIMMLPPRWETNSKESTNGMFCALVSRAVTLFAIGAVLRMALDMLQVESQFATSWLVPVSGIAATCVGLLYPYVTSEPKGDPPDGAMVIRCLAVFVGIYQASTKIYFSSYLELFVTVMALAVGMWWLFDRSRSGLVFSLLLTLFSASVTQFLFKYKVTRHLVGNDFLYPRTWSIYFSACVLFGTIGRWVQQLEYS